MSHIRHFSRESHSLTPLSFAGLVLIIVGPAGLILDHFSFTTQKKVIDIGPITAFTEEQHTIAIPDVAGIAAVFVGGGLVFLGQRRR